MISLLLRWTVRLGSVAAIAAISIIGTLLWVTVHELNDLNRHAPLTADLHGAWATVDTEFDRRVKSSFPVGSSEAQMAAELRREGFTRDDWESSLDQEHRAVRHENTFPCNAVARIYWRSDSGGRLTAIRGSYGEPLCL